MTETTETHTILGAGLSGLSAAYHLGHEHSVIYEAEDFTGGHIHSRYRDGFVWDDGPHISFTKDDYVKDLFESSVDGDYEVLQVQPANYFRGHWIDHPAQVNLYQVPEPLRTQCLESFLATRQDFDPGEEPKHYGEWLHRMYGPVFADTFPSAYTRKYWTTEPHNLDVDWIKSRMYTPDVEEVKAGAVGPLSESKHYITTARYPSHGGYISYASELRRGARISHGKRMEAIDFDRRWLGFADGSEASWSGALISSLPLPVLIAAASSVPDDVREAADLLRCTELLLVEVSADHPTQREEQWLYVYDEDKYSTRINFTERLSPNNAPKGHSGVQVEVYGSRERPLPRARDGVASAVTDELVEMGLVRGKDAVLRTDWRYVPWANVMFDLNRRAALEVVDSYLDRVGVHRIGRYGEWRYYWTDDCVLTGRRVAERVTADGARSSRGQR